MLSKSLILFSIDGWGCVPSLLFDLRPNYGGGNEGKGYLLQKVPGTHCCAFSAPSPAAGHRQPTPPPETPRHSQTSLGSLLWGHCSFLLGPGVHKLWFVPSKRPVLSSGGSMVGLMVTSSKRAYAIPRSTAPRAPTSAAGHFLPIPPQETLRHSSVSVSVGSLGPGAHRVCLSSLSVSGGYAG